jgi:hypothetical protein
VVAPVTEKQFASMRQRISRHERLTVSLRFLATGRPYEDINFTSTISPQARSKKNPETCRAIYKVLKNQYLKI